MPFEQYGPFKAVFEPTPSDATPYLSLLRLRDEHAGQALNLVRTAVRATGWQPFATTLLVDMNWRPHLVGACAVVLAPSEDVLPTLWQAFDAGSWVAPQLAVAAYLSDKLFPEKAKARIELMCPVSPPAISDPVLKHSATGPASERDRSAKNLASLLCLCARVPELSRWTADQASHPEIATLLEQDRAWDDSASITKDWLERIVALTETQGPHPDPTA